MGKMFYGAAAAAFALVCAAPAAADVFIGFTDANTSALSSVGLGTGQGTAIVGWNQTVAAINVKVSAAITTSGTSPLQWWLTTAIGPGATPADVVASGSASAATETSNTDLASAPFVDLATGVSLAAGDYYLVVLSGLPNNASWRNDAATANLASGFSLLDSYLGFPTESFAPASPLYAFSAFPTPYNSLNYRVEGDVATAAVPEPGVWALMILGFGVAGGALRTGRLRPVEVR